MGQRGACRDPERDGRLKQNQALGIKKHPTGDARQAGGQGRCKSPSSDRRLKANRNQPREFD